MKDFFTKKRITFVSILCITFIALIFMLIFPIGLYPNSFVTVYSPHQHKLIKYRNSGNPTETTSPFTVKPLFSQDENGKLIQDNILLVQTIVFSIVGLVFLVFLVLFLVDLKHAGLFAHRPTKTELLEARVAELEQQVDELKKEE